ncbi:hypothetical protein HYW43_03590 [Candidatus Daviesbacteria bacterium]|nr:hypothetical protein [Candidatus Daviesbacteria bacterium]
MGKQKLYCYVDETGQDTQGELFIVSVVVAKNDREEIPSHWKSLSRKRVKEKQNGYGLKTNSGLPI